MSGFQDPTEIPQPPSTLHQSANLSRVNSAGSGGNRFKFSFRQKKRKDEKEDHAMKPVIDSLTNISLLSVEQAQDLDHDLINEYDFTSDQLTELAGLSCAIAISKAYPKESMDKKEVAVLVCCGPSLNGGEGLVCARHLKLFGYRPTVYTPRTPSTPLLKSLVNQCEKMDIPFLYFMPNESHLLDASYNLIVDALFAHNSKANLREDFADIMSRLREAKIPICSIGIPSDWDVSEGGNPGIQPDTLLSVATPKLCSRFFAGRYHFLCGRYVPPALAAKYQLNLPPFPGVEQCVLIQSNKPPESSTAGEAGGAPAGE